MVFTVNIINGEVICSSYLGEANTGMVSRSKRSESVIIENILQETRTGVKKTRLMYNAKMSNTQLDRYLEWLLEQEIVEKRTENGSDVLYYSTEKGEKLSDLLKQILPLLNHR